MRHELRQSFALLPGGSETRIRVSKPSKSRIKKFICGRSTPTSTLPVEGPTKNKLCRTIMFSSHSSEPMIDERGLSDAGPGNDCNDVDIVVCPCTIQKIDVLLSTKNITSCHRQSGYGNLLLGIPCWLLTSSNARSGRGRLLQVLTSDSTPCVDSACYGRYRLLQLVRSLETLCRIFLKEFLKENDDRLWNIFELLKR